MFLASTASIFALRRNIQCVSEDTIPRIKPPEHETDHSPPSTGSVEVEIDVDVPPFPHAP